MQDFQQIKSPIKRKISQYLDFKGITPYKFYKETGVTRGILEQNNGISEENLSRFLAFAKDINLDWLFHSSGDMIKSYESIDFKDKRMPVVGETQNDYNSEIDILRNDYIKTANKLIKALEENIQLKERLQKYE